MKQQNLFSSEFQKKYVREGIARFDKHRPGYGNPTSISNQEKLDVWINALGWIMNEMKEQ